MENALLEIEEQGWRALSATDMKFCEEWLADEALLIVPGMVIDRATFLQALPNEEPWTSHRIEEPRVVTFAPDCAALLYKVTAQRGGQAPHVALITSVYARRNDTWKLLHHQQTPAPD